MPRALAMAIRGYRVFDAHVHMQPWSMLRPEVRAVMEKGRADVQQNLEFQRSPARFEEYLRGEGVDRALLVNYVAPDVMGFTPEVNAWIGSYTEGREMLLPMGSVHPRLTRDARREVEDLKRRYGVRALKVHPAHQLLYPHAYATEGLAAQRDLYAAAEELDVPVVVHTGTSIFPGAKNRFTEPIFLDDVAVDFPRLKLVLAHAGRPFWMDQAFFLARRHPNVFLEISGIPPATLLEYLPRAAELPEKLIFGTDWPSPGVRSIRANVEAFLDLPLSDDVKRAVLWDNAERVYGA